MEKFSCKDMRSKDVLVPQKTIDPLKEIIKQKDKRNLELKFSEDQRLMCTKSFDDVDAIRKEVGREKDLPTLFNTLLAAEKNRRSKQDLKEALMDEIKFFNEGRVGRARDNMRQASQSLEATLMYSRKSTKMALDSTKALLAKVETIAKHVKENNLYDFYTFKYTKDLPFLPKFHKKYHKIVEIQKEIVKYMSSWGLGGADSPPKSSEGNKLIDKLKQEIEQICFFIEGFCLPFFLPPDARPSGAEDPTDPRTDQENLSNRQKAVYELHRLIGEYLPLIEDPQYLKCLREATKNHGALIKSFDDCKTIEEEYKELLKELEQKHKILDECQENLNQAQAAKKICLDNYNLVLQARQEEGSIHIPVDVPVAPEVLLAMAEDEDTKGKAKVGEASGSAGQDVD
jgi:hypothetical protein